MMLVFSSVRAVTWHEEVDTDSGFSATYSWVIVCAMAQPIENAEKNIQATTHMFRRPNTSLAFENPTARPRVPL